MFNFLLFIFLFCKVNAYLPRVQGGGCIVIEDKVYYLGGNIFIPNLKEEESNHNVFTLDLRNGLKVIDNSAEWEKNETSNYPRMSWGPYVYSTTKNGTRVIVSFYQHMESKLLSIKYFDIEKNEWYNEYSIRDLYEDSITNDSQNETSFQNYFILQDEKNENLFYISGYSYNKNSKITTPFRLKSFNIETKELKLILELSYNMIIHQLFTSNNKFYYFLDLRLEDRRKSGQHKLYELDLITKSIKEYSIKIKHNDYFEMIKYRQSVYFIGYEKGEDANFLGDVYELTLAPLSFKKIKQIRINNNGCFAVYNDYLINLFGLYYINYGNERSAESSNKILLISITNWEQMDRLPSSMNDINYGEKITYTNCENIIIGCITIGLGGIILISATIVLLLYKYKIKKSRPPNIITDPIVIGPIYSLDDKYNCYDTDFFRYFHEIDNHSTTLPIKTELIANKVVY
ncbi:hypothetical protein K502DRAFT_333514 [Neoconidiobolus thromboides FSU 785]|nr:hypothetical protein K502DRAFT_333514 [Neoconidiobolus thromboides FSU 785]